MNDMNAVRPGESMQIDGASNVRDSEAPRSDARRSEARRTRMREFQTQLIERMRVARSGRAQTVSQLGVMIGTERCLVNLQHAGEIVTPGMMTPVPLTQDWYLGLMNVRGNLISVIDFARFQGQAPTPVDKASRVIAFAAHVAPHSGLLVTQVFGLRSSVAMTPQTGDDAAVRAYLDSDAQQWTELDLSLVAQDPRFLNVGL
jgi:twitching motility protein PilI